MLSSLIASIVSGEATEAVGRARRAAVIYLIAGVFILCGLGFLLGAGFVALADEIGTIPAALWFGGGFIVVALIIVLSYRFNERKKAKEAAQRRRSEVAAVTSAAALAILPSLLSSPRGRSLTLMAPAIAMIGYALWRENMSGGKKGPTDTDPLP